MSRRRRTSLRALATRLVAGRTSDDQEAAGLLALRRATLELTTAATRDELAGRIARHVVELTGADHGLILLMSTDRTSVDAFASTAVASPTDDRPGELLAPTPSEAAPGLAMQAGSAVRTAEAGDPAHQPPAWYPVALSYLAVPLLIDGQVRGEVVAAATSRVAAFTEIGELLLGIYASEAAASLEGVILRRAVDEAIEVANTERSRSGRVSQRIRTVLDIAERLTQTLDRTSLLDTILTEVTRELECDATTIRLADRGLLRVAAFTGGPADQVHRLPVFRADEGFFGEVFRTRRPWVCNDTREARAHGEAYARYPPGLDFRAEIVVPLLHGDEVIGALSAVSLEPRRWTRDEVAFAAALATHASIAIHNSDVFARSQSWAAQLAVIQSATARMNRQNTLESVGRAIVEETRRIVDYHNCRVYLLEPPDQLVPIAFEGRVGAYEKVNLDLLRCRLGEGFTGWVGEHGVPLLIHDANADPRGANIPGTDDVDESMVVVPMRYDERIVGVITLSKLGIGQFDESHVRLLAILADQAATAVETVRLLTKSRQLTLELRRLLDMSSELNQSLNPIEVADRIAQHMAQALGVDECAISYWDRPADQVLTWGFYPPTPPGELQYVFELARFPETRRVLADQATVIVDASDPAADPAEVDVLRSQGRVGLAMLPLVAKGQSIGVVELISRLPLRFDPARLEFARAMANEAAMALENARLYEAARNLADRDPLTGFYNHRYLHERLGEEIVRASRARAPIGLLMLDLDDFKLVNDTFGHLYGDQVLTWAAELIRSTLRTSDIPARYGGDEFAVILPDADAVEAGQAASRILEAFRQHAFQGAARGPIPMAASIGVAAFPEDGRATGDLIRSADAALYRVKAAGGRGSEVAGSTTAAEPGRVAAGAPADGPAGSGTGAASDGPSARARPGRARRPASAARRSASRVGESPGLPPATG